MSTNTLSTRTFLNRKTLFLIFIGAILALKNVSCVNYSRGPLEETNHSDVNDDKEGEDYDEFTGNTYLEPTEDSDDHYDESLLEMGSSVSDDLDDEEDEDDDEMEDEDEESDEKSDQDEDYLDRLIDSSLLDLGSKNSHSNFDSLTDGESSEGKKINSKYLNDNRLRDYLERVGAMDKMRGAKARGKHALSSFKSKVNSIPESYRKIKSKVLTPAKGYDYSDSNGGEKNVDHRRRLLNTMNDVDERRRHRDANRDSEDTHSEEDGVKKTDHRRRLLNTMNDVDEKRKKREGSRIGQIKRRFRRNNEYEE